MTIKIASRAWCTLRTKKERESTALCGLQTTKYNHNQGLLSTSVDPRNPRSNSRNKMVHEVGYHRRLQPHSNRGRRRMENSVQNKVWTL
jgi:hypothetical protein